MKYEDGNHTCPRDDMNDILQKSITCAQLDLFLQVYNPAYFFYPNLQMHWGARQKLPVRCSVSTKFTNIFN